jgi:hypothetical protein
MAPTHQRHDLKVAEMEKRAEPVRKAATANQIAALLRAKGVKGRKGSHMSCALAVYLNEGCSVSGRYARLIKTDPDDFGETGKVDLGPAASSFINKFDRGDYPDLVVGSR